MVLKEYEGYLAIVPKHKLKIIFYDVYETLCPLQKTDDFKEDHKQVSYD